jgi:hypothetical protein
MPGDVKQTFVTFGVNEWTGFAVQLVDVEVM